VEEYERWQFLFLNPAVVAPCWLPPAAEVPDLADLRAEHERLLAARRDAAEESRALRSQYEAELESRRAAHERAFLGEADVPVPAMTVNQEALDTAEARAAAAQDALQTFIRSAIRMINEREPDLVGGLDKIAADAERKRRKAQTLLAEADALEASTGKLRLWLDRATGRNHLGHLAWDELDAPRPRQEMTVAELYSHTTPAFAVTELQDIGGAAFGTDDPDNLDPDATPWEARINA
jgi:hypothetical protein